MEESFLRDVFEWDAPNWSKSLDIWEPYFNSKTSLNCLEVGSHLGGISLLLAKHGHKITCSDLISPSGTASRLHQKYSLQNKIKYAAVDIKNMNMKDEFDIIIFKSVIGGVARNYDIDLARKISTNLKGALKPGGVVLFAENCSGSLLHRLGRKYLRKRATWSYFSANQFKEIFSNFESFQYDTFGFWSAFSVGKLSNLILSKLDKFTSSIIPKSKKYIIFGVAKKKAIISEQE